MILKRGEFWYLRVVAAYGIKSFFNEYNNKILVSLFQGLYCKIIKVCFILN